MAYVKLRGKEYHLEKEDILNALKGVDPQPTHDFTISIHGIHYPIKQAISAAIGLSIEQFAGSEAHEFLRRLGFVIENHEQRMRKLKKRKSHHF
ncbi:MAG TPA: hypothetical protein VE201_03615 [Nitrospirales bacterium]|nr:hypothetical protein [Nitrospirales bacterium]